MPVILIVDDEEDILEFLEYNLRKEGHTVFKALNGLEAIEQANKIHPDLIILDVMMPGMDGVETCRQLREVQGFGKTVIAFLTARNEDYSQIAALDAGADDYISKPIKPSLLISRVNALLRRKTQTEGNSDAIFYAGKWKIDKHQYLIFDDEMQIEMPRKEFEIFVLLASRPGKVFTRDEILNAVWGGDIVVGDRTIDVHVRKIREKLGEDSIKTLKGVGYKFEKK